MATSLARSIPRQRPSSAEPSSDAGLDLALRVSSAQVTKRRRLEQITKQYEQSTEGRRIHLPDCEIEVGCKTDPSEIGNEQTR